MTHMKYSFVNGAAVMHEDEFRKFVQKRCTPKTASDYLADLRRVSRFTNRPVSPELIDSKESVKRIGGEMKESGENSGSVNCCMTAMSTYLKMVQMSLI